MKTLILSFLFALCGLPASYAQNLTPVKDTAGKYGYKDSKGNLVIPYKYSVAGDFSEGLAWVWEKGKGYGFIDKSDKLIIPFMYKTVLSFREGLTAAKLDKKWGFIDKKGNTVIPFSYDYVDAFSEGLAAAQPIRGQGYGYINTKGEMVIPVKFKLAFPFGKDGIARVSTETRTGVHIDRTGKIIEDEINDKTTGRGKYRISTEEEYDGDMVNGKRNGKGKNVWSGGDVYDGNWENDKASGKGKMVLANGNIYEGDWKDDLPNGKGKYKWPNGAIYEGDVVNGIMTGKGKKVLSNGNSYDGDWKDGMFNGKGKYRWDDGAVYEGDWVNGNMTGKGKYKWANGNVYNGDWKDNNLNGKGILTKTNGAVQNGDWINGNFTGVTKQSTATAGKMSNAEAAAYKALEFRDAGNYTAALPEAQKALKLDAHNFLALFARGLLYAEYDKNNTKAIDFYSKAIVANGKDYRPLLFRAYALIDTNRLADAKKDLDKAVALNPKCFDCFMLRAYVFGKEQKWAAARDEAQLALNLKPGSEKAKSNYEMYKNFADPETIDAAAYPVKEEPRTYTNNNARVNTYTQSQPIDYSKIKSIWGDEEEDYRENPAEVRKRNKRYLSQSDMDNIIKSNSPSSSSGESGWDRWFRERDRQSERDYKQKNGQYRGY